jgi:hypothetical protein
VADIKKGLGLHTLLGKMDMDFSSKFVSFPRGIFRSALTMKLVEPLTGASIISP